MASLRATINLLSTDLISTSDLSLEVQSELSPTHGGIVKAVVKATAKGTDATTLYTGDDYAAIAYLYIKNLDTTSTDYIWVYDDTSSGDPRLLKLAGGDWAWMPLVGDLTMRSYATTNPTDIEYGVFGLDQ